MKQTLLFRSLAVAGGIFIALLIAEVGLRVWWVVSDPGSLEDLTAQPLPPAGKSVSLRGLLEPSPDRAQIYRMRRHLDVVFQGVPVRTNSQGWRDREWDAPDPRETWSLLAIGDSFLFGWGVEEPARYVNLLVSDLKQRHGMPMSARIVAAPGYNLAMEVASLASLPPPVKADVLLYAFVDNDVCLPNFVRPPRRFGERRLFLEALWKPRPPPQDLIPVRSVLDPERVERFVAGDDSTLPACDQNAIPAPYCDLVGVAAFARAFRALSASAKAMGATLVVVDHTGTVSPEVAQTLATAPLVIDVATFSREEARRRGFASLAVSDLVLGPEDPHPSALAHRLIADQVGTALAAAGLVPARP